MKWIVIITGILGGAFVEGLFLKVPFVLIVLLLTILFIHKPWVILLSIPAGLLLDSMTFRILGVSSLFFAIMMGVTFAYGKKFEIKSIAFTAFSSCLSAGAYFVVFGYESFFVQLFLSITVAITGFLAILFFQEKFTPQINRYID